MKNYSFEKLDAWKHGKTICIWTYKNTRHYPDEEKFGLTSQMRRASLSIPSNLAEGSSRLTNKDKAWFTNIAYSSTLELLNHMIISNELEFLSSQHLEEGRSLIEKQTLLLSQLRKSQLGDS